MTKALERLRVCSIYLPIDLRSKAIDSKEAEAYCATKATVRMSQKHGFFKEDCTFRQFIAILTSCFSVMPIMYGLNSLSLSVILCALTIDSGLWLLALSEWKNHKQKLLAYYQAEWQKKYELTTGKLAITAKNLKVMVDFFNKQADRFNKYQRYLESGIVSLNETQWTERQALHVRLLSIRERLTKRVDQLDYLLDVETKPALEQEVIGMIDLLGQTEISNEIAKLIDPRFRTLSEAEIETKSLAVLEKLPQQI